MATQSLGTAMFDNVSTPSWPIAPPPAPAGLTATAGVEQVTLTWQEGGYATNYNVLRAPASGGSYTKIATAVGPRFVDTDLPGGTTNYYEVNAVNSAGQSANSAPASATPTANVLSPWVAQDIGAVNLPGSENFSNGAFTIYGSGADIQSTADAFRFIYVTTNSANFTIIARVTSMQNMNAWSKAGVMIRDSLNPGAANAFIGVTPGNGVTWQSRSSDGGSTSYNNTSGLSAPYWAKLVRSGSTFTGYRSPDGVNWTQQGTATITMTSTVYVGLADTAHTTANLCTATFDNVNAPGFTPASASVPTGLVATGGVEQVTLSWQASANANSYNVYRSTASGGPYTLVANATTTNYADIRLVGNGTTYYYVVTGVNSLAGESGNSAQASATTTVTVPPPWMPQDIGARGSVGQRRLRQRHVHGERVRGRHLEHGGRLPLCLYEDQQRQFHHGCPRRICAKHQCVVQSRSHDPRQLESRRGQRFNRGDAGQRSDFPIPLQRWRQLQQYHGQRQRALLG